MVFRSVFCTSYVADCETVTPPVSSPSSEVSWEEEKEEEETQLQLRFPSEASLGKNKSEQLIVDACSCAKAPYVRVSMGVSVPRACVRCSRRERETRDKRRGREGGYERSKQVKCSRPSSWSIALKKIKSSRPSSELFIVWCQPLCPTVNPILFPPPPLLFPHVYRELLLNSPPLPRGSTTLSLLPPPPPSARERPCARLRTSLSSCTYSYHVYVCILTYVPTS